MSDPDLVAGTRLPEDHPRLVGHAAQRAALLDQASRGRLPGAVLLHGPQGIGKATLAFDLAVRILTETSDETEHRVFEQVAAGSHPNLAVLRRRARDAKSFYTVIRIDDIRRLVEDLQMTRGRAGHRLAIIDTIDECNPNAANALLKMLEEPPADATIVLISHNPGRILPTIRSRCHRVALRPLADQDVAAVVREQRSEVSETDLAAAVRRAGGRPRRAFEALESDGSVLGALDAWLADPAGLSVAAQLDLAGQLAAAAKTPVLGLARELIEGWMIAEARASAMPGGDRRRLASACDLWEKAASRFAETEALNLDMRQTVVSTFDAIRLHAQQFERHPAA